MPASPARFCLSPSSHPPVVPVVVVVAPAVDPVAVVDSPAVVPVVVGEVPGNTTIQYLYLSELQE